MLTSSKNKICEICSDTFTYWHKVQRYCSIECRQIGIRKSENLRSKRNYLNKSQEQKLFEGAKARAKELKLDFNISVDDIVIPKYCPVLGYRLAPNIGKGQHNKSPTLDRVDNNQGYIKENVRVISAKANRLKSNLNRSQVERLLQYISGQR